MKILVLTNEPLKEELLSNIGAANGDFVWIDDISQLSQHQDPDVFIDLLFDKDHTGTLMDLLPKLIIINSVEYTLSETNSSFVRVNGWPGFLESDLIEAAALSESNLKRTEEVFGLLNKNIEWVKDEIGFITPRVISMIINEAFIALEENVSTKEEINTAMKLGTNYPYGPFEWAEKIGIKKIASLLRKLSEGSLRYKPSELLLHHEIV